MTRMTHFIASLVLALTLAVTSLPLPAFAMQSLEATFDLANVPLPADALPEQGYQVLTGGFLDRKLTTHWIASPRQGDPVSIDTMLSQTGWTQSYVLDMALLEDRAWAQSNILALVQTTVYLFTDENGAHDGVNALADYQAADAESIEPVIPDASTVRLVSESGDTYRSVARHERTVIEVVSLERFGSADLSDHQRVVADTFDRLSDMHASSSQAIAPRALLVSNSDAVADLFNAQQTGVHQLYRVREDAVQPAVGELNPPDIEEIAPGLMQLYQSGQVIRVGNGNGFYSSWIGDFRTEEAAASFVSGLPDDAPHALLPDPYYTNWQDEQTSSQGVAGLYRVSGESVNGTFSGTLEIQRQGTYVIGIGWRMFGSALPSVDVTSHLMDAQVLCLNSPRPCPAFPLEELMPPESATPVSPALHQDNSISSEEFGWSLSIDPAIWSINERFSEPGYDFVELQSGQSLVTFESVIDQHGDPQQCVLDEMHALQVLEEHAVIDLGSDNPDEVPAELEAGHGWAVYTVEPLAEERADQEYTIRIDCYTMVEHGASLVMTQRVPRYEWDIERGKGDVLRDSLNIPSGPLGLAPDAMLKERHTLAAPVGITNLCLFRGRPA